MKKSLKKKHYKPPPQKTFQSAEDFLENGVDCCITRMKSLGENVYTICKNGDRDGTLCKIDSVKNWTVGKFIGIPPESNSYRVKKNGKKIILSAIRGR